MTATILELAIADAIKHGKALLKFISPNDVGKTGSHQAGYYLPKKAAYLFTPFPPEVGRIANIQLQYIGRMVVPRNQW